MTVGFHPERVILAKGSVSDARRRGLVETVCGQLPDAEVVERLDVPHNRIDLGEADAPRRIAVGKRTLVLGEHNSAVRLSEERGNACPNYHHFSPYGFCPYDCGYCYLAGTRGVWFSPTVKIFVNLPEMLARIDRIARRQGREMAFYVGKLQDGLALDGLTGYSRVMVPFFAAHPFARLTLLTKSAEVANLVDLDHRGHTIVSWSLNPPEICAELETNCPSPRRRIDAMRKCAAAGYGVRAVLMPLIPAAGWRTSYEQFLRGLLTAVSLDRITLGGICSYPTARSLMRTRLGAGSAVVRALAASPWRSGDGRSRYGVARRIEMYRHLISVIRRLQPDLTVGLCLEERDVFEALDLTANIGRCNCVL